VWAERYERGINDLFAVQDEITERVVTAIDPAIRRSELRRRGRKLPGSMDAWDHFLKGSAFFYEYKRDVMPKARAHFEEAIRLAPDFALAYARLAETYGQEAWFNWTLSPAEAVDACYGWAKKAMESDEFEAAAHVPLALSLLWMRRHEAALDASYRAVDLNPNYHDAQFARGVVQTYSGHASRGHSVF
jgi:tetratricopeptide (TPR) repeat protein